MVILGRLIQLFYFMKSPSTESSQPNEEITLKLQQLGKRIRELRIKKGYSSYENFAYDHDISRAQLGRYEQGKDIRFSTLIKVIDALGVTVEEFFGTGFEK